MHYELNTVDYFEYEDDAPDKDLLDLIDAFNYADEAPTMTSTDAMYHSEMMISDAAWEIFVKAYDHSYNLVDGLSDGLMSDEYIQYMNKVENEMMQLAYKMRQRRLDAENKRHSSYYYGI